MNVLVVDLTKNSVGFEWSMTSRIVEVIGKAGHHASHWSAAAEGSPAQVGQGVGNWDGEFLVLIAHGRADRGGAAVGLDVTWPFNDYDTLRSLLPEAALRCSHKLLVICEGLNDAALAALNAGQDFCEEAVLIAKRTKVCADEAVRLTEALFGALPGGCATPLGSEEVRSALEAAKKALSSEAARDWLAFSALKVEDSA